MNYLEISGLVVASVSVALNFKLSCELINLNSRVVENDEILFDHIRDTQDRTVTLVKSLASLLEVVEATNEQVNIVVDYVDESNANLAAAISKEIVDIRVDAGIGVTSPDYFNDEFNI